MSFTVKIRGARSSMLVDYECPVHGRFEAEVRRDENGDPPASIGCPRVVATVESLMHGPCDMLCGEPSEHRMSAVRCKVRFFEAVTKGGWAKPEHKEFQDVSKLAEGQSLDEFWQERAAIREEERKREVVAFAREHHESIAGIEDFE